MKLTVLTITENRAGSIGSRRTSARTQSSPAGCSRYVSHLATVPTIFDASVNIDYRNSDQRFVTCSKALDVEPLSNVCKLLYTEPLALDLLALHIKLSDVIFYSLLLLDEYDCETVGT